jgi:hypothetical protein
LSTIQNDSDNVGICSPRCRRTSSFERTCELGLVHCTIITGIDDSELGLVHCTIIAGIDDTRSRYSHGRCSTSLVAHTVHGGWHLRAGVFVSVAIFPAYSAFPPVGDVPPGMLVCVNVCSSGWRRHRISLWHCSAQRAAFQWLYSRSSVVFAVCVSAASHRQFSRMFQCLYHSLSAFVGDGVVGLVSAPLRSTRRYDSRNRDNRRHSSLCPFSLLSLEKPWEPSCLVVPLVFR